MRAAQRATLLKLADRRWSLVRALLGMAIVVFAWLLPPNALAGVLHYSRFFFIVHSLGISLVVFGTAGLIAPGIFRKLATHESPTPWRSWAIVPLLLTAALAVSLFMIGYVLRIVI